MTAKQACEKWIERVSAYADGECGLVERILVRLHLRECERCREWLAQVRADEVAFRAAYLGEDAEEDLTDAVMARVAEQSGAEQRREQSRKRAGSQRLIEVLVAVGMLAVLGAILFPTFARSREKARTSSCMSNLKQLAIATEMFAQDHDGRLPGAVTWRDDVLPYVNNEQLFKCPSDEVDNVTYAINPLVAGRDLDEIDDHQETVLLYEIGESGRPVFPHNGGANYAFVDGHVKWYSRENAPEELQTTGFAPPTQSYGIAERLKLAYEASIEVIVDNLYQAVLQAEAAVREYGGFILNSSLDGRGGYASLTVKVPTQEVGNVINALGSLGFVAHREVAGEDLTGRYVSAQRGIEQSAERQQRLEGMVREMADDEQRVAAESSLGEVEDETAQAQDQTFDIDARATLATISATLLQGAVAPEPTGVIASFLAAARSFWRVLQGLGSVAAWVIVFLPIWGGALALVWWGVRRYVRAEEE